MCRNYLFPTGQFLEPQSELQMFLLFDSFPSEPINESSPSGLVSFFRNLKLFDPSVFVADHVSMLPLNRVKKKFCWKRFCAALCGRAWCGSSTKHYYIASPHQRLSALSIDPLITSFFHFNSFLGEIWNCLQCLHITHWDSDAAILKVVQMRESPNIGILSDVQTPVWLKGYCSISVKVVNYIFLWNENETTGHPPLHFVKWIIERLRVNGPLIREERLLSFPPSQAS